MSVRDFAPGKEVLQPRGMWSAVAQKRKGNPERASFMQNGRINPGVAASRAGTSAVTAAAGMVTGIFNWITPGSVNLVLFLDAGSLKSLIQGGAVTTLLATPPATRAPSFADLDIWTYIAGYDALGNGTMQVEIYDGATLDKAFRAPVTLTAATAVDGGPGQCTAGTHYIGFIYQNRSGFAGKPSSSIGGAPISVSITAGLRKINISVTLPALADGGGNAALFLIMTRTDTPNTWYFMPTDPQTGGVGDQPVPLNAAVTLNFVANLSDEDMAQSLAGDTANENFLLLTQDGAGNGPFNPSFVVAYGQRMCYGVGPLLYVSDINNPQHLTADQHVVTPPNKRNLGFAFPLPGSTDLYLTGDRWTSRITDNSDVPATWAQPFKVSDSLGAPFPACVCYRTGGNYAWIVTEAGVYYFDGTYGEKPITYLVSDLWKRVNWPLAYAIEIADDVNGLKLYVAVPMDGNSEPNAMFCIDYQNGMTFDEVDISLDLFTPTFFSSIGIVKELATGQSNLWIGPSLAGNIAHLDATTHNDQGAAIDSFWESGLVRGKNEWNSRMIRVGNLDIWIRGLGTLLLTLFGPDKVQSVTAQLMGNSGVPMALTPAPGTMGQAKFDLSKVENYTVRVETNAVDSWWELSGFTGYSKADLFNR
jgi:hypothetical protein